MKTILVCGGAGYIGSHMSHLLIEKGYDVVVFDNLSTGRRDFVPKGATFIEGDLRDPKAIEAVFTKHKIDAVMHFAAAISVPESVSDPLKYYENNITGCINLFKAMLAHGVKKIVFSSTAAVYGEPERNPIEETNRTLPTNPYGYTKLVIEQLLKDLDTSSGLKYIALRYFNAAGSHPSGRLGQWHPNLTNIVPAIMRVIRGDQDKLSIFGDDYPTDDGTCIRDYIHVQDLCQAHLLALKKLNTGSKSDVFNLGSGVGYSVKQVVDTVESITSKKVPHVIVGRRAGDPSKLVASYAKAKNVLGWQPENGLEEIISSAWKFERIGHARHCEQTEGNFRHCEEAFRPTKQSLIR